RPCRGGGPAAHRRPGLHHPGRGAGGGGGQVADGAGARRVRGGVADGRRAGRSPVLPTRVERVLRRVGRLLFGRGQDRRAGGVPSRRTPARPPPRWGGTEAVGRDPSLGTEAKALRLFVAVDLPAAVKAQLAETVTPFQGRIPDARWTNAGGWHVTLKFLWAT